MRKVLFAMLMAATAAVPMAVQAQETDGRAERAAARAERIQERYRQAGERNQARSERREEVRTQRVERQEDRQEARVQRQERVEAPVQQQQVERQSWSGRRDGDGQRSERWSGRDGQGDSRRQAYQRRVEETREASRVGIEQSVGGNYARQGQRNQERYERELREQYGVGQRGDRDRDWNRDGRDGRRDWNRDGRDRWSDRGDRRSSWNRSWRNDSRYDWQRYRYSNRNLFRSGRYYSPYRGYGYNRLSIGLILDSLFYSNRYWLNDPYQYRLPAAPYGTQWVRYYNDVVLVDVYTGEVLDVIYDFFW
ncbi:MAG TPA: RcnB family protein [Allosphingosinicella sp.]|jgi:hypothetical protein